ncbi:hypothetical protein SCLCIDRAFT_871368 [Scleroderma citrinum Foug A]|uniref:Uncharacterized protein n=1 Tax=Scleroderma citrinum Foug A TaxID=1036808 RepID=A0A0C3A9A4_9AGAM|nr:hypothetical protein SCLCIDRAFT_871368 [Scleroderma citrinum Foug A]
MLTGFPKQMLTIIPPNSHATYEQLSAAFTCLLRRHSSGCPPAPLANAGYFRHNMTGLLTPSTENDYHCYVFPGLGLRLKPLEVM